LFMWGVGEVQGQLTSTSTFNKRLDTEKSSTDTITTPKQSSTENLKRLAVNT